MQNPCSKAHLIDGILPQLKPGTVSHLEAEAGQSPLVYAIATREGDCEKCAW